MRDLKKYTRVCMDCGKVMHNVGCRRQRCEECSRKHKSRMSMKYYHEHYEVGSSSGSAFRRKAKAKASAEESSRAMIADNKRFVASAGSYGKGRLKEYLEAQKKRPSGVTSTEEPAKG